MDVPGFPPGFPPDFPNVRASIGVASYPHDARSPHELIHLADERMYVVKNGERDGVAVVDDR